jgi:2-amino-4-hydroxy-6-hydroxymethyldihydropteridine diphosphokinase
MSIAYLALGSNLGDRNKYITDAIGLLKASGVRVLKLSTIIETDPVGGPEQGKYLNAVLKAETNLLPEDLHCLTQSIEHRLGRLRKERNGPRTIDIDILLYDDIKLVSRNLQIPHPRMFEREFVMKPLLEIAPANTL